MNKTTNYRLLLIEDNQSDVRLIQHYLNEAMHLNLEMKHVKRLSDAQTCLVSEVFDVILLDLGLPDSDGMQTFLGIYDLARDMPIVVLTGMEDETLALQSIQSGAQDYLIKGEFDSTLLLRSIRYAIERKRTESRLRENQRMLQTLLGNLPGMVYRCANDDNWTMYFVSEGCFELTGYSDSELLHNNKIAFGELIHPDDRMIVWNAIQSALQEKIPYQISYRIKAASGEEKWVWERGCGVFSPKGKLQFLEGFITDITARKQWEKNLKEVTDRLNLALKSAKLGIWVWNMTDNTVFWDDNTHRIFGVEPGAFKGTPDEFWKQVLPEDRDRVHFEVMQSLQGAGEYNTELRVMWPDESVHIVETWGKVYYSDKGEPLRLSGVCRDITRRKRVEQELQLLQEITLAISESNDFHSALATALRMICETTGWKFGEVWLPNPDHTILEYSSICHYSVEELNAFHVASEKLTFRPEQGLPGRAWASGRAEWTKDISKESIAFFPRADIALQVGLKAALAVPISADEQVLAVLIFFMQKSREEDKRLVELVSTVAAQLGGELQRKRIAQEKGMLEKQLQQAQKLEAIGNLAGGIAHDFNNILGAILGFTEMSIMDVPQDSITQKNLQEVLRACHRGQQLVQQILTFSRQDKTERKPIQLAQIIQETLKMIRAGLPKKIEIQQIIDAEVGPVVADAGQMYRVLMNLCTNATQVMQENGGTLTVTLSAVEIDRNTSCDYAKLKGKAYVKISVSDTGPGMTPDVTERIFEPFFTTKAIGDGTGLGLSVVHGIIVNHGGEIFVNSEPGKGTTFEILLPGLGGRKEHHMSVGETIFQKNDNHFCI